MQIAFKVPVEMVALKFAQRKHNRTPDSRWRSTSRSKYTFSSPFYDVGQALVPKTYYLLASLNTTVAYVAVSTVANIGSIGYWTFPSPSRYNKMENRLKLSDVSMYSFAHVYFDP